MAEAHRHNEIELNFVSSGAITYLFGSLSIEIKAGQLTLFWGALPHRLTHTEANTQLTWLTLPLASFLKFRLPEALTQPVLHGIPVFDSSLQDNELNADDTRLFRRWLEDQNAPSTETQRILELELEARLRRFALRLEQAKTTSSPQTIVQTATKAAQLAEFIAQHYLEPIRILDVAKAVGLNANYASELFRSTFSMTILEYLTQHRIAHAQRLLFSTDLSVLEIAFEAGFGSSSQFYSAFERACGCSPSVFRKQLPQQ